MDSNDALQSFKEFTGYTNDEDARRLLSKFGWDLERAINAFFALGPRAAEGGGEGDGDEEEEIVVDREQRGSSGMAERTEWQPNRGPKHRISHFANNAWARAAAERNHRPKQAAELDDDSVRVLQDDNDVQMIEEGDSDERPTAKSKAATSSSTAAGDEPHIRAPIEPTRGVLVNQTFHDTYHNRDRMIHPVFEQYRHDHPSSSSSNGGFANHRARHIQQKMANRRPDLGEDISAVDAVTGRAAPEGTGRSQHLKQIFRPPVDLMFRGDWDQALQAARQKGVWLLVNVQDVQEFACVVLNRDIWSDETVREVVRSNFLFLQVHHDSTDGARLRGYYGFTTFPAIFIVDPRTGEEVSGRMRAPDPISFLDTLTSFLDQNPNFEARDCLFREQAMAVRSQLKQSPTAPTEQQQRTTSTTPTKKRKQPGPRSESSSGLDDNEGAREAAEMNRQAKKIKRVVTITDGEISQKPSSSSSSSFSGWRPTDLDPNEWRKWAMDGEQQQGKAGGSARAVHMAIRLPDGQQKRVRMNAGAPLSALFSLLLSLGFPPTQHQIVLDYPRREHALTLHNHRMSLELAGFGHQQEVVHVDKFK